MEDKKRTVCLSQTVLFSLYLQNKGEQIIRRLFQ